MFCAKKISLTTRIFTLAMVTIIANVGMPQKMLDPDLIIAEINSLSITAEHHIRTAVQAQDVSTLTKLHAILDRVTEYARRQVKALKQPKLDKWVLYCAWCGFNWGENVGKKNVCPDCGETMRIWDLNKGEVPPKRG